MMSICNFFQNAVKLRGKDLPGAVNVLPVGLGDVLKKRESREFHTEVSQIGILRALRMFTLIAKFGCYSSKRRAPWRSPPIWNRVEKSAKRSRNAIPESTNKHPSFQSKKTMSSCKFWFHNSWRDPRLETTVVNCLNPFSSYVFSYPKAATHISPEHVICHVVVYVVQHDFLLFQSEAAGTTTDTADTATWWGDQATEPKDNNPIRHHGSGTGHPAVGSGICRGAKSRTSPTG